MTSRSVTLDTTIDRLPPGRHRRLCQMLTIGEAWKDLASVIPNRKRTAYRFDGDAIELIKMKRDPADELLRQWKTDCVKVSELIRCLKEADLLREAAYVNQMVQQSETVVIEIQSTMDTRPLNPSGECVQSTESLTNVPSVSWESVCTWTKNFDSRSTREGGCLIGKGGYADVFRGIDESGKAVAVKKFKNSSAESCKKQFENEISVQTKCSHANVISLLGICSCPIGFCLIYEYMSNGSLEDFLAHKDGKPVPTVAQRLSIARDVAHGIAYLNSNNLIHRDIKSANVLLGDKLEAKLGDFGITRSGPSMPLSTSTKTTVLIGTTPYMAPEYLMDGRLSFKTDSFSYGVLLLELLTGLTAYDAQREEHTLLEHIRESYDDNNYYNMVDTRTENWNRTIVEKIYKTSLQLCGKEKTRPLVSSVLDEINGWCTDDADRNSESLA